ncbi:cellulose binding domain-containing protein [Phytohabitans houttuyneae]|nr:cellulose binding domain-containing protein [Phytohabitans houttuyneae]
MTGSSARRAIRFAAMVAAVPLAVAMSGTASAAPDAATSDPGGVTCEYIVFGAWSGGFSADLKIVNNGPTINGWTVRWTAPVPTSNVVGWSARMTQQGSQIVAVNMVWNGVVRTGETRAFGWSATAPSADVPTDITINGTPC